MNKPGSYDLPLKSVELRVWDLSISKAQDAARQDAATARDEGTCVLGAGVSIWVLQPRARNPRRHLLIPAPFQGNVGSYRACKRAIEILQDAGLGAQWYDGVMD